MENTNIVAKKQPKVTDYRDPQIRAKAKKRAKQKFDEMAKSPLVGQPRPTRVRGVSID